MYERHVILNGITASNGKSLVGINSNYGDTATLVRCNVLIDIVLC
jgi:pectate lyase